MFKVKKRANFNYFIHCWLGKSATTHSVLYKIIILYFQTTEEGKQEKKNDQPPQAKKPKVKTKTVELPVQNNLHWQLSTDVLNMFVENEVML